MPLAGLASLLVGAKFEDGMVPAVSEITCSTPHSKEEVLHTELQVSGAHPPRADLQPNFF